MRYTKKNQYKVPVLKSNCWLAKELEKSQKDLEEGKFYTMQEVWADLDRIRTGNITEEEWAEFQNNIEEIKANNTTLEELKRSMKGRAIDRVRS